MIFKVKVDNETITVKADKLEVYNGQLRFYNDDDGTVAQFRNWSYWTKV